MQLFYYITIIITIIIILCILYIIHNYNNIHTSIKIIKHVIPSFQNIPIKNKYEFSDINNKYDYHLIIYYLEKNKCKIILRNLSNIYGWTSDIHIYLYDMYNDNKELIIINKSDNNSFIFTYNTQIILQPINLHYNQLIPKIIIQTSHNDTAHNLMHYNSILTLQELNPEYEYIHFNDDECRIYIKNNFNEKVLNAYDTLIPGAYKADLFRYCFLYKNGGCYFDCKMILYEPLRNIIKQSDTIILCNDDIPNAYLNAIIMMVPNNNKLLDLIDKICYYVENKSYRDDDILIFERTITLSITGPIIFYEYFSHITPSIFFIRTDKNPNNCYIYNKNDVNSTKICKKQYNNYYSVYTDKHPRYDILYFNRMIYK